MATNNLRIIYDNVADRATLAASTTRGATDIDFTKKDTKSLVWQSTGTSATITVTLPSVALVGAVILAFNNLTPTATMRVQGYNGATEVVDTGVKLVAPYASLGDFIWGGDVLGMNSYSFGNNSYGRLYFTPLALTSLTLTIEDVDSEAGYLEISRLIIGNYWSPKFNHPYGATFNPIDSTSQYRTESGDLKSSRSTRYNKITFSLEYMQTEDRNNWNALTRKLGMTKGLFISLYPEDEDAGKEQCFQCYGKLSSIAATSHPLYTIFATQVEIEEI